MKKTETHSEIRDFELMNKQSPLGNFFQSCEYYNALRFANSDPFFVTADKRGVKGGLLAFTPPTAPFIKRMFPSLMVYYGPVLDKDSDPKVLDVLLNKLDSEARKRHAMRVDFRTPFPPSDLNKIFVQNGYHRFDPGGEYSVIIDLKKSETALWKEMKRFTKENIKKAKRKNVEIKEVNDEYELRRFYQIYSSTARRRNFVPHPFGLFKCLFSESQPKGTCKFFMAWLGTKPIAIILNFIYNGQCTPFINASLRKYWNFSPNHLLFWHSICWSKVKTKAQTFKIYHLPKTKCRINGIDYFTFKTSFGGDLIRECSFYYKNISPFKFRLLRAINKFSRLKFVGKFLRKVENNMKQKM